MKPDVNINDLTVAQLENLQKAIPAVIEAKQEAQVKDRQEALASINSHVEDAYASIREAQKLSDEFGVPFDFNLRAVSEYGMGGTNQPTSDPDWNNSSCWGEDESGWVSSLSQC